MTTMRNKDKGMRIILIMALISLLLMLLQSTTTRTATTTLDEAGETLNKTIVPLDEVTTAKNPSHNIIAAKTTKKRRRIVIFIHFHKAGGSSMVGLFQTRFTSWKPSRNGNPWTTATESKRSDLIHYWRYNASEFYNFVNQQPKVNFLANEWNFFTTNLASSSSSSSQSHLQPNQQNDVNIEMVTCMREPYSRFVSNLFYDGEGLTEQPFVWISHNITWATVQRSKKHHGGAGRPKENDFPVNFNRPNYYVAFLNGLADTDYNWKDLNASHHLQVAKERLHWFTSIILLDRPETYHLLRRWIPSFEEMPHQKSHSASNNRTIVGMSREEFNELNRLDIELYEYAVNLSLSQLAAATT